MNRIALSKRFAAIGFVATVWAGLLSSSTLVMAQAGSLDPTFGKGGIVTTPNTTTGCSQNVSCSVAIQSDGKIVVAGGATASNGTPELALARYTTSGSLDSTFGNGGIVVEPENNGGPAFGLAIQTDGKIITAAPQQFDLAVTRFNTNGTLDSTFGTGGTSKFRAGTFLFAPVNGGLALLADGKIVVAVNSVLVRLLTDGQLDSSFGSGGIAPLITGAQTLALLSSGKALVASSFTFDTGGVSRYNSNGSLDKTFGVVGQSPSFGGVAALVALSDGKIILGNTLVSGTASTGGNIPQGFILTRYNSDGTIDTTFGTRGAVVTNLPGEGFSAVAALAVQSNGDIVAAGVTEAKNPAFGNEPSDFALARYTPNGQLDTTFGKNGRVTTAFGTNGGNAAAVSALAIQSDGKIVAVGYDNFLKFGSPNNGFTLARYLAQ
jgi:uncharacterized delta-60 repeat protein